MIATFMGDLVEQFSSRFADVRGHKTDFKLFGTPFGVEVDEVSDDLQMEIIQLQNDELLKIHTMISCNQNVPKISVY